MSMARPWKPDAGSHEGRNFLLEMGAVGCLNPICLRCRSRDLTVQTVSDRYREISTCKTDPYVQFETMHSCEFRFVLKG